MSDDTKYDLVATATSPEEEHIIEVYTTDANGYNISEKNKKEWHGCSNYIMTIEQAKVYQEYFPENRFVVMKKDLEEFSKTGIKNYELE